MSTFLHRIGATAYGNPIKVLLAWLAVLLVLGGSLALNPPTISSEVKISGTPAQELIDDLTTSMPEAAGGQGQVVFTVEDGKLTDPERAAAFAEAADGVYALDKVIDPRKAMAAAEATAAKEIAAEIEQIATEASIAAMKEGRDPEAAGRAAAAEAAKAADEQGARQLAEATKSAVVVDGEPVLGSVVSEDGRTALLQFQFTVQTAELSADEIDAVVNAASEPLEKLDVTVTPGSTLAGLPHLAGAGEAVGLAVAAIVLVITLGSIVAAGLPLATALLGVAIGIAGTFALSFLYDLNSISVVLALMLGLAVGIDYALFIVNRQRNLILTQKLTAADAAARAVGTAGSAVFFAGLTVIIALVALVVVGISLLTTMAMVAAATVGIAVLIALTFLPALLGLVKERIVSEKARTKRASAPAEESHKVASAWSKFLVKNRWLATLGVVAVTGVMAVPVLDMELGLPSGESYATGSGQRDSYDAVTEAFGEGLNGPLVVIARSVTTQPLAEENLAEVTRQISALDDVADVVVAGSKEDGTMAMVIVTPETGPTDARTTDLVHAIRDLSDGFQSDLLTEVGVTGQTAMGVDISEKMGEVMPIYIGIVLGLSLIVLLLVFRSIIVPIKATVGFLLSILATFGATTALFQWGWLQGLFGLDSTGPVLALLPIIVTGVLYGLAMDYQVFLVSSMRESWVHGHKGTDAVVHGFSTSSRVVVAAAIIMVSVFAGFVFNGDPMVKQMGFGLAIGILIDAFLVRMTLVPAVMAMFGDRAWALPKWLDKALPDLDVEGDKLIKKLEAQDAAPAATPTA